MSTKPFFLTYVKRETDVRKKNWLSGYRLFANRPTKTVSSLPSDRRLTTPVNTRQNPDSVDKGFIMSQLGSHDVPSPQNMGGHNKWLPFTIDELSNSIHAYFLTASYNCHCLMEHECELLPSCGSYWWGNDEVSTSMLLIYICLQAWLGYYCDCGRRPNVDVCHISKTKPIVLLCNR